MAAAATTISDEKFENEAEAQAVTKVDERALIRKLDRTLLPALTLLYLLSFLDRSNGISCNVEFS